MNTQALVTAPSRQPRAQHVQPRVGRPLPEPRPTHKPRRQYLRRNSESQIAGFEWAPAARRGAGHVAEAGLSVTGSAPRIQLRRRPPGRSRSSWDGLRIIPDEN